MMGAQTSLVQQEKILSYIKLGKKRELLTGGEQNHLEGDLAGGYYIKPTLLRE
jgi:aldehyde dehydrogenase